MRYLLTINIGPHRQQLIAGGDKALTTVKRWVLMQLVEDITKDEASSMALSLFDIVGTGRCTGMAHGSISFTMRSYEG